MTAAFGSPRLDGSIRTLTGLFTSSLAELQLEAARCLHELSHSSVPTVAEACLPVTSYLLTYLSGHSLELTVRSTGTLVCLVLASSGHIYVGVLVTQGPLETEIFWHHSLALRAGLLPVPRCNDLALTVEN